MFTEVGKSLLASILATVEDIGDTVAFLQTSNVLTGRALDVDAGTKVRYHYEFIPVR